MKKALDLRICMLALPLAFMMGLCVIVTGTSVAGSFYSCKGVGLWQFYSGGRGAGMGGIGVALIDNLAINCQNPAARVPGTLSRISGDFNFISTDLRAGHGTGAANQSLAAGFHGQIPFSRTVSLSVGLSQVSSVDYAATETDSVNGETYTRYAKGEGGLHKAEIALFVAPSQRVFIGASADFYFGRILETWAIDFVSSDFQSSRDKISTHMQGVGGTVGVVVRPLQRWNVGALVSTRTTLSADTDVSYAFSRVDSSFSYDMTLPLTWGLGTTVWARDWLLVGADFLTQAWGDVGKSPTTIWSYGDARQVAVGAEMTPSRSPSAGYLKQLSYRFGFRYRDLNIRDAEGDVVREYFATMGLGMPFYSYFGRIDVAVEYGKRGSLDVNPVEEKVLRVLVSVSGGERWFQRR